MILNPYRDRVTALPGTRILEALTGVEGVRVPDPQNMFRMWEVQTLYLPIAGRALGGIRAKLVDQKGFVTFCNQRDLEVLLGFGTPGSFCPWSGTRYVSPDDSEWFGFCCDEEDLRDDLFEREMFLRAQTPGGVLISAPGFDLTRRIHISATYDAEEVFVFLQDMDPETGFFPDTRFETLERRWARSERERIRWERI
jgi:hypothetical protein